MNLKIALAAALLLTGATSVSHAQGKVATAATTVTSKSFLTKVNEFEKAGDATKSSSVLQELKQQMTTGLASAKSEMATSDEAARTALMQKYQVRLNVLNQVTKLGADVMTNKSAITTALKQYAATL